MTILAAAAALGLDVQGRKAACFNSLGHLGGRDDHPSLVFYPESGRFMCFACGVRGDVIDLVRGVRGVTFAQAVEWIESQQGGPLATAGIAPRRTLVPTVRVPDDKARDVYAALYQNTYEIFPNSPVGQYLRRRGLRVDLVNRCRATEMRNPERTWAELFDTFGQQQLLDAGLISRHGHFLFANHILLFFYFDDGEPVFIQGRDISGQSHCKELSLAGLRSPVPYNSDVLRLRPAEVYVCEGCIDTLSALQMGLSAVGVPGVIGFATDWFDRFRGVGRTHILFDNDEAGRSQGLALRTRFRQRGVVADVVHVRGVKDVNDLLLKKTKETQNERQH